MKIKRTGLLARISILTLALAIFVPSFIASAATVTSGSLTLGDSRPSQSTTYAFTASGFTTATPIMCVQLRLNTAANGSGSAVVGSRQS